jgi:asparagine synthase (glutamine-hydrolysing)
MAARPKLDHPTPCYTYGGFYRNCFDVGTATEVASACGQPHHLIPLERDFFNNFATLAERAVYLTDGCESVGGAHELYFSERARSIAPIRVTGNYGSEVLRSVDTFNGAVPSDDLFAPDVFASCQAALARFNQVKAVNEVTFAAMQNIPWHLFGRLAVAQSQLVVRSPYMDNDLVALTYRAPAALRKSNELSLRLIRDLSPRLHTIPTDMGYGGEQPAILSVPRRLARYATFKAEWYYNLGMPKWLGPLDRPLLRPLSPLFLGWHKIDHMRPWFRDQLSGYLRDMLSDPQLTTRPYVNPRTRAKLLPKTITGRFVHEVSLLLTLELVHRTLLRTPTPARPTIRDRALSSP